jgi:YVTN family beta-propeller protein
MHIECRHKTTPAEVPMTMGKVLMLSAADATPAAAADVTPAAEARLLGSIAVGHGPISDIAVDPDDATIIATNSGDDSVSVCDARTLRVEAVAPVVGQPFAVATAGGRAFVAGSEPTDDSVSAIDTRSKTFLASLPLDLQVVDIAASHDGRRLFVSGTGPETADLAIVDVESGRVRTVAVADADSVVGGVRVASNGRFVYVATSDTYRGKLTAIDVTRARIAGVVPTGSPVQDFVTSADGSVAYVLGRDPSYGGFVETIDTTTTRVLATTSIGGHPTQFALGVEGTRMYIVDVDRVAVMCLITNEIVDALAVGTQPSCVVVSRSGTRLYVADYTGAVTAFAVASQSSFGDVIDVEPIAVLRELEPAGA